jgi:hypothetical protein
MGSCGTQSNVYAWFNGLYINRGGRSSGSSGHGIDNWNGNSGIDNWNGSNGIDNWNGNSGHGIDNWCGSWLFDWGSICRSSIDERSSVNRDSRFRVDLGDLRLNELRR